MIEMHSKLLFVVFLAATNASSGSSYDLLDMLNFIWPASSASAAITGLALNSGSRKASEWFYLSDWAKAQAALSVRVFEDKSRISLSAKKAPFFCSTILYLQGAALAVQSDARDSISTRSPFHPASVASLVNSLLSAYPSAEGYAGYCVLLFPSPSWRAADPPCEGTHGFPEQDFVPGVSLFSLKCLAASDFDWRTVSPGVRPGGVSALGATFASVVPFSKRHVCSHKRNSDMIVNIVGLAIQSLFTQLMVAPVSAMLTMEVKEVCGNGFDGDSCLRFENLVDILFESLNHAESAGGQLASDIMCLVARVDSDLFAAPSNDEGGGH